MKVFIITPHAEYYHGNALVVAENEEEAINLYKQADEFNQFLYRDGRCSCKEFEGLNYEGKEIILIDDLSAD